MRQMCESVARSSLDGSLEPCLFDLPEGIAGAPLPVGPHTRSADRFHQVEAPAGADGFTA